MRQGRRHDCPSWQDAMLARASCLDAVCIPETCAWPCCNTHAHGPDMRECSCRCAQPCKGPHAVLIQRDYALPSTCNPRAGALHGQGQSASTELPTSHRNATAVSGAPLRRRRTPYVSPVASSQPIAICNVCITLCSLQRGTSAITYAQTHSLCTSLLLPDVSSLPTTTIDRVALHSGSFSAGCACLHWYCSSR